LSRHRRTPLLNPSLELNSEEAGTTGIMGTSLVVRYAEPSFHKALSSFFPVVPVVLLAQSKTGVCLRESFLYVRSRQGVDGRARRYRTASSRSWRHRVYSSARNAWPVQPVAASPFTVARTDSFEREDWKGGRMKRNFRRDRRVAMCETAVGRF